MAVRTELVNVTDAPAGSIAANARSVALARELNTLWPGRKTSVTGFGRPERVSTTTVDADVISL
jgi:hypothetical protein